jgi:hypothetical protein
MGFNMQAAGTNGVQSATEIVVLDGYVDDKVLLVTGDLPTLTNDVNGIVAGGNQGGAGVLAKGGENGPGVVGVAGINSLDPAKDNLDLFTKGRACGVAGFSGDPAAVGPAPLEGCGVFGQSRDTPNPPPLGLPGPGRGVHGQAESGIGVLGEATKSTLLSSGASDEGTGIGVKGTGTTTGVHGQGDASAHGVRGVGRIGVVGISPSDTGPGVVGRTNIPKSDSLERFQINLGRPHVGVAGLVGSLDPRSNPTREIDPNAVGVYGAAAPTMEKTSLGFAGVFDGQVTVNGAFVVTGPKSAAVPHPDGSHRMLYSVESPESWFEDFGEEKLVEGKAEVRLDPDFAAVVKTTAYHVFLSPYGDSNGLYVTRRSQTGFEVREQKKGTNNLRFSYRIVAKRKDVPGHRLAKVTLPAVIAKPAAPELPGRRKRKTREK